MNNRTIIIIIALALPVVLLALVMSSGSASHPGTVPAAARNATNFPPQRPTLEQARNNVKNRIAQLEKMTPDQWPQERKAHPNAPATLQEALTWNKNRLAQLEAMTPEQWQAQPKARPQTAAAPQTPVQQSAVGQNPQAAAPAR